MYRSRLQLLTSHPDFQKMLDTIALAEISPGKVVELVMENAQREFALSYVFSKTIVSEPKFIMVHAQAKNALDNLISNPHAFDPKDKIEPTWIDGTTPTSPPK